MTYTKENCRFATGTLPGSTEKSLEYIARYSGWIINRMTQWWRDTAPGGEYVFVWEWQERGALHAHFIFAHTDDAKLEKLEEAFFKQWGNILEDVTEMSGVDMFERDYGGTWRWNHQECMTSVEKIRESVHGYLGKYLSKSESKSAAGKTYFPSRWWGASKGAKRLSTALANVAVSVLMPLEEALSEAELLGSVLSHAAGVVFSYENPYLVGSVTRIARTCIYEVKLLFEWLREMLPAQRLTSPRVQAARWNLTEAFGEAPPVVRWDSIRGSLKKQSFALRKL